MSKLTLTQKFIKSINDKIVEIESYAIDTQENEERYIHEINCLLETKFLLTTNHE
jgi:DNA-binding protein